MASPWHHVIALGTDGGDPCVNGDTLGQGVHLLWTMAPDLGFPVHGYEVLRRRHRQPQWTCTVFDADNVPPAGSMSWSWQDWRFEADPGPVRFLGNACGKRPGLFLPGTQTLTVTAGGFVILFPHDVHMPGLVAERVERVRKIVVKVRI